MATVCHEVLGQVATQLSTKSAQLASVNRGAPDGAHWLDSRPDDKDVLEHLKVTLDRVDVPSIAALATSVATVACPAW